MTIAAISSAVGPAARMIVRLSGPQAFALAKTVSPGDLAHTAAVRRMFHTHGVSFPAWIYSFCAPRSVTGEDVVEFHLPGNPLLAKWVLNDLLERGARMAEPGEFTARGYFNGKLDLTAAEGVAATIAARSDAQLKAARQLLAGELARRVRPMVDQLAQTLALVEVGIDFSEEEVTFLSTAELAQHIDLSIAQIDDLLAQSQQLEAISHEPVVVLVGRPNAGKSTLINALAQHERSVVSDQAGTTRDVLWTNVTLKRGIVKMADVAGLQTTLAESPADTPTARIEQAMQRRAREAIESADVIVLVQAIDDAAAPVALDRSVDLFVLTKADLLQQNGDATPPASPFADAAAQFDHVLLSVHESRGMDELIDRLDSICFGQTDRGSFALNARHLQHLSDAASALARANTAHTAGRGPEVVAMELREALDQLGAIVGSISPDELLGLVFSKFCIGK
jgi:tRNA modification GTPase